VLVEPCADAQLVADAAAAAAFDAVAEEFSLALYMECSVTYPSFLAEQDIFGEYVGRLADFDSGFGADACDIVAVDVAVDVVVDDAGTLGLVVDFRVSSASGVASVVAFDMGWVAAWS
jgi:hypothetical protein